MKMLIDGLSLKVPTLDIESKQSRPTILYTKVSTSISIYLDLTSLNRTLVSPLKKQ